VHKSRFGVKEQMPKLGLPINGKTAAKKRHKQAVNRYPHHHFDIKEVHNGFIAYALQLHARHVVVADAEP
jgi:hypothetical protein